VLTKIYGVPSSSTAYYFMVFAAGNLLGPLLLGRLFDSVGRRKMIAGTYFVSGVLAFSAFRFKAGVLNAVTQTFCWCVIFFFASAGASAAYLTVSKIFPVEVRAKAIAVFFATAVFFAIVQCFGAPGTYRRPAWQTSPGRRGLRRRGASSPSIPLTGVIQNESPGRDRPHY
jgi:MFS family permease